MTSIDDLERAYRDACVAACEGIQIRDNAIHVIPTHLAWAVYHALERLGKTRLAAMAASAKTSEDDEIIQAGVGFGTTETNRQTVAWVVKKIRAAGFSISRKASP